MSVKYEFIATERATTDPDGTPRYQLKQMCTWLSVSASGFFDWRQRPDSATARRRQRLALRPERRRPLLRRGLHRHPLRARGLRARVRVGRPDVRLELPLCPGHEVVGQVRTWSYALSV